jgi:hypothetical protein
MFPARNVTARVVMMGGPPSLALANLNQISNIQKVPLSKGRGRAFLQGKCMFHREGRRDFFKGRYEGFFQGKGFS